MATVLREDSDGICTLTLNRPEKLNSLSVQVFEELSGYIEELKNQTTDVGCVILKGAGRCFSAGHDLADISAGEALPEPHFQAKVIERLANLEQPVISAVHGYCYTGALELALAGDIILASSNAKFSDTHAKWALVPIWGLSQRLPRRVGRAKAMEMMITCQNYSGQEAVDIGLANQCYPEDRFEDEVLNFAKRVLENSWFCLRANKKLLVETENLPLGAGLAHETYTYQGRGPDYKERVKSFLDRKKGTSKTNQ